VAPKPNPARREELLEAVTEYVLENGIADLSLRPLASALNVSTFSLVYHFGSKEGLVAAVVSAVEERERQMTAAWLEGPEPISLGRLMRRYWAEWCLPEELTAYHRLFYETCGLSLQHPARFPDFLQRGAGPWLPFVEHAAREAGLRQDEAGTIATLMVSAILGALLTMLVSGNREQATRAVEAVADWIDDLTSGRSTIS